MHSKTIEPNRELDAVSHIDFLFTIDTEVYPINRDWRADNLARDVDRDIYGETAKGAFGVAYQLEVFAKYGIKAVFFVEGLHASCTAVGIEPLTKLVQLIQSYGQEVQLHLHPEWVPLSSGLSVPDRGHLLTFYNQDEQCKLIETAANNLLKAGATAPIAFRAGDYAANLDTLKALARVGFQFDTSYNFPYLHSTCKIEQDRTLWQAANIHDVWEFPVSCYRDYPGHFRHCELAACSVGEIDASLKSALDNLWSTYVFVSHSFELINNRRSPAPVGPKWRVVRRFENLCKLLSSLARKGTVTTRGFADLQPTPLPDAGPIAGSLTHYAWRNIEQAMEVIRARTA